MEQTVDTVTEASALGVPTCPPEEEVEAGEALKLTKATGGQVQTGG